MPGVSDLRSFVTALRERGLLYDIRGEVDPSGELGAVLYACEQAGRAAFFHRVRGHEMPLFAGGLGFPAGVATALGCTPEEVGERVTQAMRQPLPPVITQAPAPAQEVVVRDVDLEAYLPVPVHAPGDAGRFITGGVTVARHPETGVHNLSFNRMQLHGGAVAGFSVNEWRHVGRALEAARRAGRRLPVCIAVGVDPVLQLAAACRYEGDEYQLAGGLRGEPVPLVRALCSDTLVPAQAEIVLECEVDPDERMMEGPMAEFTGHYSDASPKHVAHVVAITHRRRPIFQTVAGASREHVYMGNSVPREPMLRSHVERLCAGVRAVHLPPYASGFLALISLDRDNPGEARNAAMAALTSHVNVKMAVVVDADVDIFNPAEVFWALATRVRGERDIVTVPGSQGHELDPTADGRGVLTKVIIDATLDPRPGREFKKVVYPRVNLSDYLDTAAAE